MALRAKGHVSLIAVAAAMTLHAPATAQDEPDVDPLTGETVAENEVDENTIVVTAQRRVQRLQDVPLAVTVYSGEALSERQISTLSDLSQIAPSVQFTQSTNALNSSVQIRGVGTSVFSSAVEPSVSFVVDGVVLSRQGQAFTDLIDIERVEVLRGPQSTLFGKNASAGVINVVTKRPSATFEGQADLLIAEDNEYRARASVSGPITDTVRTRLTGFYTDVEGHIFNQFDGRDLNGSKAYGARGKLEFDLGEAANLLLIGDYRKSEDDCCQYQARIINAPNFLAVNSDLEPGPENREVNVNAPVFNDTESYGVSGELNVEFGDLTLTSITAFREWDFGNNIDVDGTPSIGGGITGFDLNSGITNIDQFSQELRLTSPTGGTIEYIVGAYYFDLKLDRRFDRILCLAGLSPDSCPPGGLFGGAIPFLQSGFFEGEVDNRNYAAFADLTLNATDRLRLTGGVRVLREELDVSLIRPRERLLDRGGILNDELAPARIFVDEDGDGVRDDIVQNGDISDTAVTGRAVVQYTFNPDLNIFASYSRGYKGPTADVAFDPDFIPGGPRDQFVPVDPETANAYEVGLRSTTADGALTLNITGFLANYDDFQSQSFDAAAATFILSNVGSVRTKGVEVEALVRPTPGLTFDIGFVFTDAEVREFFNGPCSTPASLDPDCRPNGTKDLEGARLPNAPEYRVIIGGRYEQPLGDNFEGFMQTNVRFQSDTQFSITQSPATIQDGYAVVDASIGFGTINDRFRITGFVKNLFDQNYVNFLFSDPLLTQQINIDQYAPKEADRYFGISLATQF